MGLAAAAGLSPPEAAAPNETPPDGFEAVSAALGVPKVNPEEAGLDESVNGLLLQR